MTTLTRNQSRLVDQLATERLAIPGIVLMENASRGIADEVEHWLRNRPGAQPTPWRFVILCGGGNNGGDGYAVARHLVCRGHEVSILATKAPGELAGDAAVNAEIASRMNLPINVIESSDDIAAVRNMLAGATMIIDGLLGTGFSGDVREPMKSLIDAANEAGPVIAAVDAPSGLDCETGQPGNATVVAALTVTMVSRKTGFDAPQAQPYLGEVFVRDIGTPPWLIDEVLAQSAGDQSAPG